MNMFDCFDCTSGCIFRLIGFLEDEPLSPFLIVLQALPGLSCMSCIIIMSTDSSTWAVDIYSSSSALGRSLVNQSVGVPASYTWFYLGASM